jgi:hypothetical protein
MEATMSRRPKDGVTAMTNAERQRQYRQRRRMAKAGNFGGSREDQALETARALTRRLCELGMDVGKSHDPREYQAVSWARRIVYLLEPPLHVRTSRDQDAPLICGAPAGGKRITNEYAFGLSFQEQRCRKCEEGFGKHHPPRWLAMPIRRWDDDP